MPSLVQTSPGDPIGVALLKAFAGIFILILVLGLIPVIFKWIRHPRQTIKSGKRLIKPFLLVVAVGALSLIALVVVTDIQKQAEFTRVQCLAAINPKELEGCVFWSRNDVLRYEEDWYGEFKQQEDQGYCDSRYTLRCKEISQFGMEVPVACPGEEEAGNRWEDPKCDFSAFEDNKRNQQWGYLTSDDRDKFYNSCVARYCP